MSDGNTPPLALSSFIAAAIGWVTLEFVARPYRKFYDLRGEIIQLLVQTANVHARFKEIRDGSGNLETIPLSDEQIKSLEATETSFRKLAARMSAFAENETWALWVAWASGYDPAKASEGLIGVSNTRSIYGEQRFFHLRTLAKALKLKNAQGAP